MATKPKIRNKKEVKVPTGSGSLVITFRTRKTKGAVKNTRKVLVPRAAAQVAVKFKKSTTKKTTPKR